MAIRLTTQLVKLERQWEGKQIGIGFDIDEATGDATVTFGPAGDDALAVRIVGDVRSVFVGRGEEN
jgi:hypothetical protein